MSKDISAIVNRPDFVPLRYPGGKRRLVIAVADLLQRAGNPTRLLVEPFAGGAAVSIALMEAGLTDQIALADKDELLAAFWSIVFSGDADLLAERILNANITVQEWQKLKNLQYHKGFKTDFERAYACLFLNRTSFSGILHQRAGPIGGKNQTSRNKINCRFNRDTLGKRIVQLSQQRHKVLFVRNQGYEKSLSDVNKMLLSREMPEQLVWYLDPPFFEKADKLYRYVFNENDHLRLKQQLARIRGRWILSYDNVPEARRLYSDHPGFSEVSLLYSARVNGKKRTVGSEIVVSNILADLKLRSQKPSNLQLCSATIPSPVSSLQSLLLPEAEGAL